MIDHVDSDLRERLRACLPTPSDGSDASTDVIAAVATAILERFEPWLIVLYGSRAYGIPTAESDVDVMVVMDAPHGVGKQADAIRVALPKLRQPTISVLVRTPDRIAIGLAEGDFFLCRVMRQGVTLLEQAGASQRIDAMVAERLHTQSPGELKHATRGWLDKADGWLRMAELFLEKQGAEDTICFYGQEVSMATLRAFLQEQDVEFTREDDVGALARLAMPLMPELASMQRDLDWVSRYTLDVCYPDPPVTDFDPGKAIEIAGRVLALVRGELGLTMEAKR